MKSLKLNFVQKIGLIIFSSLIMLACNNEPASAEMKKVSPPEMDLQSAVISGNLDQVRQHIAAGSDLNQAEPMGGSTPLITASTFDKRDIAKALIEAGADVNLQNKDGSTALHSAALFGRVEIIQMLVNAEAKLDIRNNYGANAKDLVSSDFQEMLPVLQMMEQQLKPFGLTINYPELEKARPVIAVMLQ